jgi:hypothetical protein
MQYTEGLSRTQLVSGTMAHDAVLRNLEVLGEAAKNVPDAMRHLDDTSRGAASQGCATSWHTPTSASTTTSCGAWWSRKYRLLPRLASLRARL